MRSIVPLTTLQRERKFISPGTVLEVEDDEADDLIDRGVARDALPSDIAREAEIQAAALEADDDAGDAPAPKSKGGRKKRKTPGISNG